MKVFSSSIQAGTYSLSPFGHSGLPEAIKLIKLEEDADQRPEKRSTDLINSLE